MAIFTFTALSVAAMAIAGIFDYTSSVFACVIGLIGAIFELVVFLEFVPRPKHETVWHAMNFILFLGSIALSLAMQVGYNEIVPAKE